MAVMNGIIILTQYRLLIDRDCSRIAAVQKAGELQMRLAPMTCVTAGVGRLPAALSSGIGSEVQKPLAIVMVGG